jgi:hypothetical protein
MHIEMRKTYLHKREHIFLRFKNDFVNNLSIVVKMYRLSL